MRSLRRFLVLGLVLMSLAPSAAWADAIVITSLDLSQLQIAPTSGILQILSPVTAFTFGQALDSLGGFDQQTNSVNDAATSVSAMTTLANASAAASAPALMGSVKANVNLPNNFDAFASPQGQALLSGMFEITGASGPVGVQFSAFLAASQSLLTNGFGQSATSEVTFTLLLPDINSSPALFYDNLLTLGPDQLLAAASNPTLTTSLILQPNTPYSFFAELDAESNGVTTIPEPSSILLLLTALGLSAVLGHRGWRVRRDSRHSAR